jgi:hypothetical protein
MPKPSTRKFRAWKKKKKKIISILHYTKRIAKYFVK